MTQVSTAFNNFARAQADHDMDGRFDLPIYSSSAEKVFNFITNFKGNAIYRTGFEDILAFEDCALVEFKFSQNQNYILVLFANTMRFLSYDGSGNFGWVLDGGSNILEVTTPYSLAESKTIAKTHSTTQNFDSMIMCHPDHPPYELIRVAANDFTFYPQPRKSDPFDTTFSAAKNINAITQATEAQVTFTAAHGLSETDYISFSGVVGMTQINNYSAAVIEVVSTTVVRINLDTSGFSAYTSGGNAVEVTAGDWPAVPLFYKGRLYYFATDNFITKMWASEAGDFQEFTAASGADAPFNFTFAELTSRIEWAFPGQNSLITGTNDKILAVNGGSVGVAIDAENIDAIVTSADGCNSAAPFTKDDFIFYASNNGRNMFYFQYDLLSETFGAQDANTISYDITRTGITKLRYVKNREDLIIALRGDGRLATCNFNKRENIIGWHEHALGAAGVFQDIAQISDNDGNQQLFALTLHNGEYYIERQAEYVEFSRRKDFFTNTGDSLTDKENDDDAFYRMQAEELKECIYLDNASTVSNLQTTTITYDSVAGTITDASGPFTSGDVDKQIVYKTATGYESGRFLITAYNSATKVEVEVLQTPTSDTYSSWYLTFSTISGLSRFDGLTVSVVADGGYLDDFAVSSGEIDLGREVTHAVVGYIYRGEIKSFSLGFLAQGYNTQATMKAISRVGVRANDTAGGKVGTSPYRLDPVQDILQGSLNYLPPLPINTTKYVNYVDTSQLDKFLYVVQDLPLPMKVSAVMLEADYALRG